MLLTQKRITIAPPTTKVTIDDNQTIHVSFEQFHFDIDKIKQALDSTKSDQSHSISSITFKRNGDKVSYDDINNFYVDNYNLTVEYIYNDRTTDTPMNKSIIITVIALTQKQLSVLTKQQVSGLDISGLTQEQVSGLTKQQLSWLTPDQRKILNL